MELFAKDTANLLDALNINRAHVLGLSMGTNIALEFVLRYSAKVDKLILYAADCGGKEAIQPDPKHMKMMIDTSGTARERGERLLKILFPPKWLEEHPDIFSYFPRPSETSSAGNIDRQTKAMLGWKGAFSRLPRIKKSVLLITGTEDVLTPPKNSFIIAQRIPGSWVVQLKEGGHGVMYQYPKQMSRIIHTFIETQ